MALYQCLLLGAPTPEQARSFTATLDEYLTLFGYYAGLVAFMLALAPFIR